MDILKQAILEHGENLGNGVLKIDGILNHQVDTKLIIALGEEIANRFRDAHPTRVLTVETSGLVPGFATALSLHVPMVFARKTKPVTMSGPVLLETTTHAEEGREVVLMVAAEFMPAGERVLIVDDFLASGETLRALARITQDAHCILVGIAVVVEKRFDGGREFLKKYQDVPIEALVTIASLDDQKITFA